MSDKGLKANSVGLFGGTLLGISSVAPAYVLTATVGILAMAVGAQTPVVIIAGFLPMFFAAYAYREFNKVMPDSGTSFTWTSKAFGPYVGWIGGWTAVVATIIVLSNLAGVAVQFLYQFVGSAVGSETISALWENKPINVLTCLAFLAVATWVAYRGIDATEKVQIVLVSFQMIMLIVFAIMAFMKHETSGVGADFSWAWFSPAGLTLSAFIVGLSGSIFGFWGWDTALTVNEESKDSDHGPGLAALLCVVSILITYLMVTIAMQMFAGLGDTGLGLRNEDVSDNVFGNLAEPVLGMPLALGLYLAVLASSAASLITTFLPTTRTLLAMGAYGAMPKRFAHIHPRFKSPSTATITAGIAAAVFYTVMTILSERVLTDTILSLGIMICFYYGLVAFGCIWFFRHTLFDNAFNVVFKLVFPLLGGLGLFFVLVITLKDSASPDYGSGASVFGVGLVLVLGLGLILIGIVFMLRMRAMQPAFFRGETLRHEAAHNMKQHEHLEF
ncbi:MAG TPA: APC family permease [Microlunatus sp.]|nr:APC family permease [Microlunatus sp.]